MLFAIDQRLHADILHVLASMGHGDCIALVDLNFPAVSTASHCVRPGVIALDAASTAEAAGVIAGLMPLEEAPLAAGYFMRVDGAPDMVPPVVAEVIDTVAATQPPAGGIEGLERHGFYEQARRCFAVVRTRERRFYGSVILRKGVIHPDA